MPAGHLTTKLMIGLGLAALGAGLWRGATPVAPTPSLETERAATTAETLKRNAALQSRVRALLLEGGLAETGVVKTFAEEKEDQGRRWVQDFIEVKAPAAFSRHQFMTKLTPYLTANGFRVMKDQANDQEWELVLGDGERVFQRVIVRGRP